MLLLHKNSLNGAILHHPTVPLRTKEVKQLKDLPIFIGAGTNDNICKPDGTKELESIFRATGGKVEVHWEDHGHSLTSTEVQAAAKFYNEMNM